MRIGRLLRAALFFLTLAAVAQELGKPEDQRTWHGKVAGVPYDFRVLCSADSTPAGGLQPPRRARLAGRR